MTLWSRLYRYGVYPIYWLTPKPGEFYRMVVALSEATVPKAEVSTTDDSDEPAEASGQGDRSRRNPWQPLWNGLVFIAIMLVLGSWVFERSDF